jgi:internalin A
LTNLTKLWLNGCGNYGNEITDISPLAGLTNLTEINLGYNGITDISPLAGLTNLDLPPEN